MTLLKIIMYIICAMYIFLYMTKPYKNKYVIDMYIGGIGSGKTTSIVQYAYKVNKGKTPWKRVYCNVPSIHGTYYFDFKSMIKELNEDYCPFPPDSCVCIDEGGIEMFSRNFKAFDMELVKLFKLVRHHKLYVRIYSQSFDIDKVVRNLVSNLYLTKKLFNVLAWHRPIRKKLGIAQDEDGNGQLVDTYEYDFPLFSHFTYIPRWVQFFDSYAVEKEVNEVYTYTPYDKDEVTSLSIWGYVKRLGLRLTKRFTDGKIMRNIRITISSTALICRKKAYDFFSKPYKAFKGAVRVRNKK